MGLLVNQQQDCSTTLTLMHALLKEYSNVAQEFDKITTTAEGGYIHSLVLPLIMIAAELFLNFVLIKFPPHCLHMRLWLGADTIGELLVH